LGIRSCVLESGVSSYSIEHEEDSRVIKLRQQPPTVWESLFAEEVAELWEPWMRVVDDLLEDEELVDAVYEAQGKRHPQSRQRGRQQTPAEVALRMLILKHVRNWSYETLEREVRANVVYRSFCRIGMEKVPDAKTLVRLGQAIGPETVRELHDQPRTVSGTGARVNNNDARLRQRSARQLAESVLGNECLRVPDLLRKHYFAPQSS